MVYNIISYYLVNNIAHIDENIPRKNADKLVHSNSNDLGKSKNQKRADLPLLTNFKCDALIKTILLMSITPIKLIKLAIL